MYRYESHTGLAPLLTRYKTRDTDTGFLLDFQQQQQQQHSRLQQQQP